MLNNPKAGVPSWVPRATYRTQLNLGFTFEDAAGVVGYLAALGVSDLYASPYLQARAGSLHGYDISDHSRLNPDLGGLEGHQLLSRQLRRHEMGHLLDIVPNHMGIGESSNHWWMDVLENGPSSPFATYFDIDWHPLQPELTGKVLLPVLGDQFGQILESGELRIFFEEGRFRLAYYDQVFPVSPRSSSLILRTVLAEMGGEPAEDDEEGLELTSILTALEHLPSRDRTDRANVAERRRESFVSRRRLRALHGSSPRFREAVEHALNAYNGQVGEARSFDDLERVLSDQAYRLAYWRVAAEEINYRRFFDINELAGVRVERPEVFQATHRLILQLVAEHKVTGLRIDHPDGLFHPASYLAHLQAEASERAGGRPFYLLVEKILTGDEPLPEHWPVAGTVGYEFLNRVNGLFVRRENAAAMSGAYERFIGERIDFGRLVYEKKKLILRVALASELHVLAHLLNRISEKNRRSRDFTLGSLTDALRETIACFPVYRTYIDAGSGHMRPADIENVTRAVQTAVRRNRPTSRTIFDFVRDTLLLRWPDDLDDDAREEHAAFVMKFQQLSGPVMAKGVEDTSFYIYNRLVSLNEVGGEPDRFGVEPGELHAWLVERSRVWPHAMSTSSTHDTKRSEDVRARINVLSEVPEEWEERVSRWRDMNAAKKQEVDGEPVPGPNEEYLLYQTLVGAWPLGDRAEDEHAEFTRRIQQYMEKATREAKVNTSWVNQNEEYDEGLRAFVGRILRPDVGAAGEDPFLRDVVEYHRELARDGMMNSLAQTLFKLTAPGVPDIYQGQEIWDFSLVDPDNRRPIDYELRRRLLDDVEERIATMDEKPEVVGELLEEWEDGRVKLYVTRLALALRQAEPELFARGEYIPLVPEGEFAEHLFAFARRTEQRTAITVVPRLPRTFRRRTGADVIDGRSWGETRITGPAPVLNGSFRNALNGRPAEASGAGTDRADFAVRDLLAGFPLALLVNQRD